MTFPEELRDITFDKSAFGYRVDDVDDYVEKVTAVISGLLEENQELEEKLEILAAKVAEYKEDEDSLHAAVLGAQKLGDSIVRDSKLKAEGILREASVRSERMVEAAQKKVETEQQNFVRIHKEVGDFRNSLIAMYKAHIDLISNLPTAQKEAEKTQQSDIPLPNDESAAVEDVEQIVEQEQMEQTAEILEEASAQPFTPQEPEEMHSEQPAYDAEASYDEEVQQPRHSSRFGDLLFGQNIDIR